MDSRWKCVRGFLLSVIGLAVPTAAMAETLVIAASREVAPLVMALGRAFEDAHPQMRVRVHADKSQDLRQTITTMKNSGRHFIGSGPVHLIAPDDSKVLTRLENLHYVLAGSSRAYATVPLVLVALRSKRGELPPSFENLSDHDGLRVAVADARVTMLGVQTERVLDELDLRHAFRGRWEVAHDEQGVVDLLRHDKADVGIVLGPQSVKDSRLLQVLAWAPVHAYDQKVYEMATDRFCPDRALCEEFLGFLESKGARAVVSALGYGIPPLTQRTEEGR